jgi:hypothetical protein
MDKFYDFSRTLNCTFPSTKDMCYDRICAEQQNCFDVCGVRLHDDSYEDDCSIYERIIESNSVDCIAKCDETILFQMKQCDEEVKDCLSDCVIDSKTDDEDDCEYMERVAKSNNVDCILDCNEDITDKLLNRVEKCNVTLDMEDLSAFQEFGYFQSGTVMNTVLPLVLFAYLVM